MFSVAQFGGAALFSNLAQVATFVFICPARRKFFPENQSSLNYPQKFCMSIVFAFPWDDCQIQAKLEAILMQNSRVNKFYYGQSESGQCQKN